DVRGYYYWSLMDNYEWSQGMSVKMGLYGVDGQDAQKTRHIRSGGTAYGRIAASGEIPGDLASQYPLPREPRRNLAQNLDGPRSPGFKQDCQQSTASTLSLRRCPD